MARTAEGEEEGLGLGGAGRLPWQVAEGLRGVEDVAVCGYIEAGREDLLFSGYVKYKTLKNNISCGPDPSQLWGRWGFSEMQKRTRAREGCGGRSRDLRLLRASGSLPECPKLKPRRVGEMSTDSGGGWITPKLLCDGRDAM